MSLTIPYCCLPVAGAGKTIALCELARDLIQRASESASRRDAAAHADAQRYPLPVILRLAPWRPAHRQDLKTWIDSQLKIQYGLGQTHIDEIRRRGLILLLDGLDEVGGLHRPSCVKAINDYCAQEGWINIVVTCRSGEYADLENARQGLTIPKKQVITLAPLEATRIERFLDQLDRVGIHVAHLHSLLESENTPLMTDVILQTYEGKPAERMDEVQAANVWENYVARKFEDEKNRRQASGKPLRYPPAMTRKWLSWVARNVSAHTRDQHRFFVEELQPNWLSGGGMILSNLVTFAILLAAAYLLVQFTVRAGLSILYGLEGVQNYLGDYLRIVTPLGSVWLVFLIWAFARRSASYFVPIALGLLSGSCLRRHDLDHFPRQAHVGPDRRRHHGHHRDRADQERAQNPRFLRQANRVCEAPDMELV